MDDPLAKRFWGIAKGFFEAEIESDVSIVLRAFTAKGGEADDHLIPVDL